MFVFPKCRYSNIWYNYLFGKSFRDKNCERIKLSRELNSLGHLTFAAVANNYVKMKRVFFAMEQAYPLFF